MTTIAVTGATGNIGGAVARALAGEGIALTLVVRDAARAPALPGCSVAVAEYRKGPQMTAALRGVDVLLFVSASEAEDRLAEHRTVVQAAVDAGVKHIVYTSFVGAGSDSNFTLARDHGFTEEAIRESGLQFTFLRDNFYLDLLPEFADDKGVIRGPANDGRMAAVARADVADAAAAVLRDPAAHVGATYNLTGREAITFTELASRVSAIIGRPLSFHDETVDEAYESRAHFGAPSWQVNAWVSTYTAIRDGELAAISTDIRTLTGHEARVIEDIFTRSQA